MALVRRYSEDAAPTIAFEVVGAGRSDGWMDWAHELELAAAVEARLAKFNIGYVDDHSGAWGYRRRGSRLLRTLLEHLGSEPPVQSKRREYEIRFVTEADATAFVDRWAREFGAGATVDGRTVRVRVRPGGPRPLQIAAMATMHRGQIVI